MAIREEIKIGGCGYVYIRENNTHRLYYDSNDKGWRKDLQGELATQIEDAGNGLKIRQEKKNRLDYSEAVEIQFLLNKIMK